MVCAPVRSIIPSLKLGDYLSVQAHKTILYLSLIKKMSIRSTIVSPYPVIMVIVREVCVN